MPTPPTIGITSIGAGVGKSVVDACRLSGLSLRLVGMGNNPFAFGAFDCDARTSLPSIDDPGYVDALHQRCREHGISILIPGLDAELLPLANHRERFLADGIDLIVAAEPVVALCVDKLRTFREMAPYSEAFIATAEVAHWGDLTCQQPLPWPLIAKPRGGCASRAVRVINHLDDLQRLGPDDILQRVAIPRQGDPHRQVFLEGLNRGVLVQVSELSVQVVIGKDGRNLGRMATCNRLVNGVPIEIVTVDVPEVWAEIDQMLPRLLTLGLRGPLNIQGRLTDDGPRFVEMNARFTGITGVRAMMGFNEVAAVILDAMNRPVKPCTLRANPRRIGLRLTTDRVVDIYRDEALAQAVEAVDARATAGSGRRVLVTGANSYLGRATLDALLDSPAVAGITALVRNPARFSTGGEPPLPAGVLVHDLDDLWNGTLNMGHYEVLIHLASGRPQHRDETIAESLRLTRDLMTLAAKHQLPGIINASSQSVYGLSRPPLWGEDMSPRPETAYAQAKWAAELMTLIPQQINTTTASTSLRFAQLIGLGTAMRWSELPHLFVQRACTGEGISIQGGQQRLDYVHVRDAARAIVSLCQRPFKDWPAVLNIGSGATLTLLDFSRLLTQVSREILERTPTIEIIPASLELKRGMCIRLARNSLEWRPEISVEASLREIAKFVRQQGARLSSSDPS